MNAAGQTRIETAHGAHDVYALEIFGAVLLEDRRILHGILVGSRSTVNITRVGVPRRRRIWVIISDFTITNNDMVREYAAHGFVETAADCFFRHLELIPGLRP